jgi:glycosyltransferase involved in cell wall biosynthesis
VVGAGTIITKNVSPYTIVTSSKTNKIRQRFNEEQIIEHEKRLNKKPIVAMDVSSVGKGGGTYTSTMNLINSSLNEKIDFELIVYKTELGRFISIKRIRDLVNQLKKIQPDIVHFTGLQLSGFHLVIACKLARIKKTIVVIHGSSSEALNINSLKKWFINLLEMLTLSLTTTHYGVSKYSSQLSVTKKFKQKSSGYIYNLPPKFDNNEKTSFRHDFGFEKDDIIVVSVGRIIKDKGYSILQKTIEDFNDGTPQVKFLIIGDGSYLQEMQQSLNSQIKKNKVLFLGYRSDILEILPMCDIFVLPTLHETLSIALLEASACRLPLIASRTGGIPEIIEHGYNGLLVNPGNSQELSDAIKELAKDDTKRRRMGINAKNRLVEKFSAENIVNQVYFVYKSLLTN